jgi:glycogen synthase
MRILMLTTRWAPTVGGLQRVAALLRRVFVQRGHEVTVATAEPLTSRKPDEHVVRINKLYSVGRMWRNCDVALIHGNTLRLGWPTLFLKKPVWMIHHMIERRRVNALRRGLLQRCHHIAVSKYIAAKLPMPSTVIPDPYDDNLFNVRQSIPRNRDVIFVGRLIFEKGVDLLIEAVGKVKRRGISLSVTIVGIGPELENLKNMVQQNDLSREFLFSGELVGHALAEELNRHTFLVIPSRGDEGFGVVALEGIACGCVVVASNSGGLPEAVGPCGFLFERDSAESLANCLDQLLNDKTRIAAARSHNAPHLMKFTPNVIADQYLALLRKM